MEESEESNSEIPHSEFARFKSGDPVAQERLLQALYADLHRIAERLMSGEQAGHSLQPTALIDEAYLRLIGPEQPDWQGRTHFLSAAARDMRRILVDHARRKKAEKRGGARIRVTLTDDNLPVSPEVDLMELDDGLEKLARSFERQARVVDCRYFAGLTVEETADALRVSPRTVKSDARFALAWLHRELARTDDRG